MDKLTHQELKDLITGTGSFNSLSELGRQIIIHQLYWFRDVLKLLKIDRSRTISLIQNHRWISEEFKAVYFEAIGSHESGAANIYINTLKGGPSCK